MNIDTGHLVSDTKYAREDGDYTPVPSEYNRAARRALNGRGETTINIKGQSKLAKWACEERKKSRRAGEKAGRKAARKGRRS